MTRQRRRGPGGPHFGHRRTEPLDAGQVHQLQIERLGHPGEVVIPLERLAELEARVELAALLDEAKKMALHQVESLVEARLRSRVARLGPAAELTEEERVPQ